MHTAIIHKFAKDKYQKRFPELDSLIVGEMEYMNAVKELGNDLDEAKNNEKLQQILTQATIMIVSVTASTTQGFVLITILRRFQDFQKKNHCFFSTPQNTTNKR